MGIFKDIESLKKLNDLLDEHQKEFKTTASALQKELRDSREKHLEKQKKLKDYIDNI